MPLTGDKKPFAVVPAPAVPARLVQYRLSPDGKWLAYSSTESGREEVYVTHFPSGQGRWQISQNGGTFPAWSNNGKEVWFIATDLVMHVASVNSKSQEFEMGPLQSMFQITYTSPVGTPYDVTPDGKKLVLCTFPESVPTPLVLVTNWGAELQKR